VLPRWKPVRRAGARRQRIAGPAIRSASPRARRRPPPRSPACWDVPASNPSAAPHPARRKAPRPLQRPAPHPPPPPDPRRGRRSQWQPPRLDQALQQGGVYVFDGDRVAFSRNDEATGAHADLGGVVDLVAGLVARSEAGAERCAAPRQAGAGAGGSS
jgi:hypothetical protein